ncbi:MAG: hypothetical protein ACRDGT_13090 [Candidatus Limnocylindria bacterium]
MIGSRRYNAEEPCVGARAHSTATMGRTKYASGGREDALLAAKPLVA